MEGGSRAGGASCPSPGGPPLAGPGLSDSEGGVTQGALTALGTPGDLPGQFSHICHTGIKFLIPQCITLGMVRFRLGRAGRSPREKHNPPTHRLSAQLSGAERQALA